MPDDRIVEWARGLAKHDARAFRRARRRFLRQPSIKRLHDLRTSARRLRSLYEDLREAVPAPANKRLHRLIDLTGEARDAEVQRAMLHAALDSHERHAARELLRELRKRERVALKRIRREVKRVNLLPL
jgi:CHAD domain-containing protein